jgi:Siphovirus Gp157
MSGPSAWKLEQAMSVLLSVRQRLLDDDPEMASDEKLFSDMLDGESGDAMEVLDAVIRASIIATSMAAEAASRAKSISDRATRYKARAEALRGAAFGALSALDIRRHERPDFTASIRMGQPAVVITDESALPAAFVRTKTEPEKTLIAAALKAGQDVPGAALTNQTPSIQVRTT